jgi:hypothetical protein
MSEKHASPPVPTSTDPALVGLIAQLAEVIGRLTPKPRDIYEDGAKEFRDRIEARQAPPFRVYKDCVSPWTGAKFTCTVDAKGVVTRIYDYVYPERVMKHVAEGGEVPNDWAMTDDTKHDGSNDRVEVSQYKGWRYKETFWKDATLVKGSKLPAGNGTLVETNIEAAAE